MGSIKTVANLAVAGKLPNLDIGPMRRRKVRADHLTAAFMAMYGRQIAIMDPRSRVIEHIGADVRREEAMRLLRTSRVADNAQQAAAPASKPAKRESRAPAPAVEAVVAEEPVAEEPVVEEVTASDEVGAQAELITELRMFSKAELLTLAEVHGLELSSQLRKDDIIVELAQVDDLDVSLLDEPADDSKSDDLLNDL